MQSLYVLPAVLLAVCAQGYQLDPEFIDNPYPAWYVGDDVTRHRRDVTLDKHINENARFFATLGQNQNGLFGRGGYEHRLFNDNRGTLSAQAHGTRVLGPAGDSSHLGGSLNWRNPNAAASLDVSRQIHGGTSYQAAAGGRWPLGKNGDFSLQGTYGRDAGRDRNYGGRADLNYRW